MIDTIQGTGLFKVKAGSLVERVNWTVLDSPSLFRPGGHFHQAPAEHVTADNAGDTLFLRVERQTLRQLPRTRAVVFSIRTYVYPLAKIATDPDVAARLAAAVRGLPAELSRYKSVGVFVEPLLAFLDARAAG